MQSVQGKRSRKLAFPSGPPKMGIKTNNVGLKFLLMFAILESKDGKYARVIKTFVPGLS